MIFQNDRRPLDSDPHGNQPEAVVVPHAPHPGHPDPADILNNPQVVFSMSESEG